MIHRIEIENYRSIREKQVIDLTLPATTPEMDRFVASYGIPSIRLPTIVAFFGPNAAGKTTVLRAVANVIDFVLHSFSNIRPNQSILYFLPFRSSYWEKRPTRISIDFDAFWVGDTPNLLRYQVVIENGPHRDAERVGFESLAIKDGRRFRSLFRRDERGIRCAPELNLPPSDSRLKAVRENASFVSTMAQLNHPILREAWQDIALTQRNIWGLEIVRPNIDDALKYLYEHQDVLDAFRKNIRRLDLGLTDLKIENTSHGMIAKFSHEGLDNDIFHFEESNGTLRFLTIFPSLWFTLQTGRPALVDEFDVDLHPLLIPVLLDWFQNSKINENKSQLFLAAHNASILDHLEKEEIFLVEKSSDGASKVIPLRSIQGLRREPSLQRKYLGGVFGAVPNIG